MRYLVGGLEHEFYFSIYWECHHPNWWTPSFFQRGSNHQPVVINDISILFWGLPSSRCFQFKSMSSSTYSNKIMVLHHIHSYPRYFPDFPSYKSMESMVIPSSHPVKVGSWRRISQRLAPNHAFFLGGTSHRSLVGSNYIYIVLHIYIYICVYIYICSCVSCHPPTTSPGTNT